MYTQSRLNVYLLYIQVVKTKLSKWGNSLGIRIPKDSIEQAQFEEGMELDILVENNKLILTPRSKKYSLTELLEGMTEEHLHKEVDWGKPTGQEQW